MAIERRDKAEQSAQDYLRSFLFTTKGYSPGEVVLVDSFPYDQFKSKLTTNYIASGFNFDDGGKVAELGSDFTRRIYTMEFFVFGKSNTWGRNLANTIEAAFEPNGTVPIKDIGNTGLPTGETMLVESSMAQKVVVRDPRPWEYFLHLARVKMLDEYYAGLQ
ncbi:MAG: hypothetical protein NVS3B1_07840 [Marmoricola sp.]